MKRNSQLLFLCLFMVLGLLLSFAPIHVSDGVDKILHFVGFALLTIFSISTFIEYFGKKYIDYFLLFLITFGGLLSAVSEFLQKYVAGRECCVYDWMANLFGIAIIVVITYLNVSKERKNFEIREGCFNFKDLPTFF